MKRATLIIGLFLSGFLFTQCNDDCGDFNYSKSPPIGISQIRTTTQALWDTEPTSNIDSFGIYMYVDFLFAKNITPCGFISTAYACSPPPTPIYDATEFIDSILVYSEPAYRFTNDITALLNFENNTDLTSFNDFTDRRILNDEGNGYFFLKEKPLQSDSFTFSFYYYNDGAIIDSSFTQKYFITN
ncbi:MAG: hypothetical protein ABF317_00070 [Bacteroidia bacterium]